ncbi:MAG: hypothetical protein ACRD0J_13825 [Acidimicrobiales bacterium]
MGLTYSSVVDAALLDVFAWHARPGAIARLTPPWLPVRVVEEAAWLRDGRAVLALPGGSRWVADHLAPAARRDRRPVPPPGPRGNATPCARSGQHQTWRRPAMTLPTTGSDPDRLLRPGPAPAVGQDADRPVAGRRH